MHFFVSWELVSMAFSLVLLTLDDQPNIANERENAAK